MTNKTDTKKRVFLRTFGCQMNMYDTEVAEGILEKAGYQIVCGACDRVDEGRRTFPDADIFLMNTCAVREHAEERVYGRLGMLAKLKKKKPGMVLGLLGCMPEQHKENLFKRFPHLDLMVGTRNIRDLPRLIDEVLEGRRQLAEIRQNGISIEYTDQIKRKDPYHAWLPIMTGCNKVCTFCVVPSTRGAEVSVPWSAVCQEASRLAGEGVKWITLLGQNVNSYDGQGSGPSFPELLERLCQVKGVERFSFTTSHPQDATPELFRVIARNPKISRRFHLPLQSGSDRMLKRMKRLHTYDQFRRKVAEMRDRIKDVSVTTDIIVGFAGESEIDYGATRKALEELRFDGAFIYKYSVRPGTPAAKLDDDVPRGIKEERNRELLDLQRKISRENNRLWLGREVNAFVEGTSRKNSAELIARTDQEKKVVFCGDEKWIGSFQTLRIESLRHETFAGQKIG